MGKQIERIDQYIRDFGSITHADAVKQLGICGFTARISDMNKMGYPLKFEWEEGRNKYGEKVSYKRYFYNDDKKGIYTN